MSFVHERSHGADTRRAKRVPTDPEHERVPYRGERDRVLQDLLDALPGRIDLAGLIGESVVLETRGGQRVGACPLHKPYDEKTLVVDSPGNRFHCGRCGFSGSAIGWLMYTEGMSIEESAMELRERLDEPRPAPVHAKDLEQAARSRQNRLERCTQDWRRALEQSPEAQHYLIDKRGLTAGSLERFDIGWCPAREHAPGRQARALWRAGVLVRQKSGRFWPRFGGRIMFPIRDARGLITGFGGRAIDDERMPKYMNSSGSRLFQKENLLYGLHEATSGPVAPERLILVEGYLDVVSLHQAGIAGAVAPLGTAVNEVHLGEILRRVDELVLCLDADSAGRKATFRTLCEALAILEEDQQVGVAVMPAGRDPDDVIKQHGAACMRALLLSPVAIEDWLFDRVVTDKLASARRARGARPPGVADLAGMDIGTRARVAVTARELIARCTSIAVADTLRRRFEKGLGVTL